MSYTDDEPLECVDSYRPDHECRGEVAYFDPSGRGRGAPRCDVSADERLARYEGDSLERYADSDVAPDWFDPTYAGERWSDDY